MRVSSLRNGVLFICVGFVLLLNTLGKLDWSIWMQILSLWPILLIAIGIELLFKKTPLAFLAIISPILIFLAIIGPVYFNRIDGQVPSFALKEYSWAEKPDSPVSKATFILDISKGELEISSGQEDLIWAKLKFWGRKPYCRVHYSDSDSSATLEIKEREGRWRNRLWENLKDNDWDIKLSTQPVFDLRIYSAVSKVDLDLSGIRVEKLRLEIDVGKANIRLGTLVPLLKTEIESDVSDVAILVPKESGLKIISDADLSSTDFNLVLNKEKDTFFTENFQTAENKIEISLDGAISSLKIGTY